MARPSIITDEFIADFCSKVRVGGSIATAIKTSGCGRETFYGWQRQVKEGVGSPLAKKLMAAVARAEGEIKMIREAKLSKHFDKNWQALAWWLERKYSQEYGQRRPLPLPDEDAEPERQVERIVWRKAPAGLAGPAAASSPELAGGPDTLLPDVDPLADQPVIQEPAPAQEPKEIEDPYPE